MKIIDKLFLIILIVTTFIFNSCFQTEKKFSKGMFMNSEMNSGKYVSESVINSPKTLWKYKTGGQVISSPVIVSDVLFVGSNDSKMYAFNAKTGEVVWTYKTTGEIRSTPLITNGTVLFLSSDGYFYALDQFEGNLIWRFKTEGEYIFNVKDYYNGEFKPDFWDFYLSSAVEKNGVVYFGSSDANIYALNIKNGTKVWSFKTEGSIHSSPAIKNNSLVIGSWDSRVYCIDILNGKQKWSFETGRDVKDYIWIGIQASPSIDNGVAYVGSRDAKIYALNMISGDTIWTKNEFDRSWMPSSMAIDSANLYTGSSDSFSFFSINKRTGKINYKTKTNAYTFSTPAIDNKMGYVGAANGRLFGIDLKTGNIKWEYKTVGANTDSIKLFNKTGKMDYERNKKLTEGIDNMTALSKIYKQSFISVGAILSSPIISQQIIYFGSSDGYVYAISDK